MLSDNLSPSQAQSQPVPQPVYDECEESCHILQECQLSRIPMFQHIPKHFRKTFADSYSRCLDSASHGRPLDIAKLFCFAKSILAVPNQFKGRKSSLNNKKIKEVLRQRISLWESDWKLQWDLVKRECTRTDGSSQTNLRDVNSTRCKELARNGRLSAALKALMSKGILPADPKIYEELLKKHPQSVTQLPPIEDRPSEPIQVDFSQVATALRSFPCGSAGGGSGIRASHIYEALSTIPLDENNYCLKALTAFINTLLRGKISSRLSPFIAGAVLVALKKKDNGIRPIAIGEVYRRICSKLCSKASRFLQKSHFEPLQLGVGTSSGCEAIIHSSNSLIKSHGENSDIVMVLVDLTNAFNNADRATFLEETYKLNIGCYSWYRYCYEEPSNLYFGDSIIKSSAGSQQGDPGGPQLFSLALHPIITKIAAECPSLLLNSWYLDDGVLIGKPEDLCRALSIIKRDGPGKGIFLNPQKCKFWWPSLDVNKCKPLEQYARPVLESGVELLGGALGDASFCRKTLQARVEKIEEGCNLLKSLGHAQVAYQILRHCAGYSKMAFASRIFEPDKIRPILELFDTIIDDCMFSFIGAHLNHDQRTQMTLSIKMGGLAIPSAVERSPAAYICSVLKAEPLCRSLLKSNFQDNLEVDKELAQLNERIPEESKLDATVLKSMIKPQAFISNVLDTHKFNALFSSSGIRNKARLNSLRLPHSGSFLNATPNDLWNLTFTNEEFSSLVRYHLGVDVFDATTFAKNCPRCQKPQDASGDHCLVCQHGPKIPRHNSVAGTLLSLAQQAALAPRFEPPNLIRNSSERPADVLIPVWTGGRPLAIDVSVTCPVAESYVLKASQVIGSAAAERAALKRVKYTQICEENGLNFSPFVLESFGGFGPDAVHLLSKISSAIATRGYLSPGEAKIRSMNKIAHTIQKMIARSFVDFPGFHV